MHGCEPLSIKKLMLSIEENTPCGRLFDIDVLTGSLDGDIPVKVSREELGYGKRKCLLCESDAFTCVRSGRHRVPEVMMKAVQLILSCGAVTEKLLSGSEEYLAVFEKHGCGPEDPDSGFAAALALNAVKALLYEAITTPKPGLVDSENSGAHRDMDIGTFFESAAALAPYFKACVMCGQALKDEDPALVLSEIRPLGILCEKNMYLATGGVNTHKGAVFSFGVILAAMGMLCGKEAGTEDILILAGKIASPMKNGSPGIRSESAGGYPSVRNTGLPVLLSYMNENACGTENLNTEALNAAGVRTLLSLIESVDDDNVRRRAMCDGAVWAKERAHYLISQGYSGEAFLNAVSDLDREFIMRNISPGGCADLLAITYFLAGPLLSC